MTSVVPAPPETPSGFDPKRYLRWVRMVVVAVIGGTVVLAGVIMIFTPGPATIVVPAGIAILATEFAWAKRLLERAKRLIEGRARRRKARQEAEQQCESPSPPPLPPTPDGR